MLWTIDEAECDSFGRVESECLISPACAATLAGSEDRLEAVLCDLFPNILPSKSDRVCGLPEGKELFVFSVDDLGSQGDLPFLLIGREKFICFMSGAS